MKDIWAPFRSKQALLQMGLCALIFVGMAVPFKVMVLVEGLTEVRPVNAVPVVAGLLLGPAGAWGCALGNLVADLFGTFSKASLLGFWANFFAAYLPYKVWHTLRPETKPNVKSGVNILIYLMLSAVSSLIVAVFLTCGLEVWLKMWIPNLFLIIFYNNLGFPIALGLPVFIVLTSDAHQVQPLMPPSRTRAQLLLNRVLLALLTATRAALGLLIVRGTAMSTSPGMCFLGFMYLLSLVLYLLS